MTGAGVLLAAELCSYSSHHHLLAPWVPRRGEVPWDSQQMKARGKSLSLAMWTKNIAEVKMEVGS